MIQHKIIYSIISSAFRADYTECILITSENTCIHGAELVFHLHSASQLHVLNVAPWWSQEAVCDLYVTFAVLDVCLLLQSNLMEETEGKTFTLKELLGPPPPPPPVL